MIADRNQGKKPFIFDHVFESSLDKDLTSPTQLKSFLNKLMGSLVAVFGHSQLMGVELKAVPNSWKRTVEILKTKYLKVTIDEAVADFLRIMEDDPDWMTRTPDEQIRAENLDEWKAAAGELVAYAPQYLMDDLVERFDSENNSDEEEDPLVETTIERQAKAVEHGEPTNSEEISKWRKCFDGFLSLFSKKQSTPKLTNMEDTEDTASLLQDQESPDTLQKQDEARKVVGLILTFFSSDNEILWFR